jgi:copper resistance protein C
MRSRLRLLTAALAACLLTVLTAGPAFAHAELESSTPANGATLPAAPTTVSLTFGEPVTLRADPIKVTGPGDVAWTVGKATISGATITAPVTATGPAGAYTLAWQVVSDDGDAVKGEVRFTLSAAATPATPTVTAAATAQSAPTAAPETATPAPAAQPSEGVPGWVWVLLGVVLVAGVAGVVVTRSRRP